MEKTKNSYKKSGVNISLANSFVNHIANLSRQLNDNVNSPSHYNSGAVECIDAIEAMLSPEEYTGYLRGNSLKYRWRFPYKNGIEDILKAEWYENKLKEILLERKTNR